jgi:hypothetical protein
MREIEGENNRGSEAKNSYFIAAFSRKKLLLLHRFFEVRIHHLVDGFFVLSATLFRILLYVCNVCFQCIDPLLCCAAAAAQSSTDDS